MASIILKTALFLTAGSGVVSAVGDTVVVSLLDALRYVAEGRATWVNLTAQPIRSVIPSTLTSLTGAGVASMNSLLIRDVPVGFEIKVYIAADGGNPRTYKKVPVAALVADGDGIIEPVDYDATANPYVLLRVS